MEVTEDQLRHIELHQKEFDELKTGQTVRDYFHDYSHIEDLYERVTDDLDLECEFRDHGPLCPKCGGLTWFVDGPPGTAEGEPMQCSDCRNQFYGRLE